MRKNIAIIKGGYSSEREISLKSGAVVAKFLKETDYVLYPVDISKDGWYYIDSEGNKLIINREDFSLNLGEKSIHFDCVFNAIHGTPGEDGLIQAYLELLSIPHTSCNAYTSALTFNKRDLLSVLKSYGIPSAKSMAVNKGEPIDLQKMVEKIGLPCFVKANRAGSSFGISKVYFQEDLPAALEHAFKEDHQVLVEGFLEGTEVSVGVITYEGKVKVLPITEIVTENDFFDYSAKYEGQSQEITPARISEEMRVKVAKMAERIYTLLEAKGFCRSEFIIVDDTPYLLEVNTTPGLTEESILPQQALCAGIGLTELFRSAVEEALISR